MPLVTPRAPLPPFYESGHCPKCGELQVGTSYCTKGWMKDYGSYHVHHGVDEGEEHLDRVCSRCGYTWIEAVLVAAVPTSEPEVCFRSEGEGEPTIRMTGVRTSGHDGITIAAVHPILFVGGEAGLTLLCEMVREQWRQGRDFVIDFTALTSYEKATIEFRR